MIRVEASPIQGADTNTVLDAWTLCAGAGAGAGLSVLLAIPPTCSRTTQHASRPSESSNTFTDFAALQASSGILVETLLPEGYQRMSVCMIDLMSTRDCSHGDVVVQCLLQLWI